GLRRDSAPRRLLAFRPGPQSRTGSAGDGRVGAGPSRRKSRRSVMSDNAEWPPIPFAPWKDSCAALHLQTQIVGKYRLAHTPWVNHSWHATLYVNADGLTTGLVPDGPGITVQFDLQRQRLVASCPTGKSDGFPLEPMSIAAFDSRFKETIATLGGSPEYHGCPNELPDAIPFAEDTAARPWDADAVSRFHRALVRIDAVFNEFRTGFLGKVS